VKSINADMYCAVRGAGADSFQPSEVNYSSQEQEKKGEGEMREMK
jgi:hypothetical protein